MALDAEYEKALDFYLNIISAQNKSKHTIVAYRQDLRRFLSWYQLRYGLSLVDLTPQMINEYQQFMAHGTPMRPLSGLKISLKRLIHRKGKKKTDQRSLIDFLAHTALGVNSRRRNMSGLHNFFNILLESSYFKNKMSANPVRLGLHRIKVKETDITPTAVLDAKSWRVLNNKTWKTDERLLIHLLYFAGLRLSEAVALKASSLDLRKGVIDLMRKGGKRHRLKIYKEGKTVISLWRLHCSKQGLKKDSPLLSGRGGRAISPRGLSKKIAKILKKANLDSKLGPHSFRKGCATALYKESKDLLFVRNYLNHTDAKVTQTYIDEMGITGLTS